MRLIDIDRAEVMLKKAAIHMLNGHPDSYDTGVSNGLIEASDIIAHAPTVDAIIPVRCEECKFLTYDNYHEIYYCANTRGLRAPLSMDNFCSYGERKSGTQPLREDV